MSLRVVGAGIGRTGTLSLKLALERLLGAPCYHMFEVRLHRRDHVPSWHRALDEPPDWDQLFEGYAAAVDWPASAFWPELAAAYPDAPVVLSTRESAEAWWRSADRTIFVRMRSAPPEGEAEWSAMMTDLLRRRFTDRVDDAAACMAAYERHNAAVRAAVPVERLVEWQATDGWGPLCAALGVPEPDEPFPVTNTSEEFRARTGLDAGEPPTV